MLYLCCSWGGCSDMMLSCGAVWLVCAMSCATSGPSWSCLSQRAGGRARVSGCQQVMACVLWRASGVACEAAGTCAAPSQKRVWCDRRVRRSRRRRIRKVGCAARRSWLKHLSPSVAATSPLRPCPFPVRNPLPCVQISIQTAPPRCSVSARAHANCARTLRL